MTHKIKFIARDRRARELLIPPIPAASYVPDWWIEAPQFEAIPGVSTETKRSFFGKAANHSFKKCVPMHDALTTGYLVQLWADVWVNEGMNPEFEKEPSWKTYTADVMEGVPGDLAIFQPHGPSANAMARPEEMAKGVHKFQTLMYIETPPGYSVLVTQPLGYRNLPFQAIPAVIDSDTKGIELLFPMWIRKDFTGLVERGTPVAQVIPFKREDWKMEFDHLPDGEFEHRDDLAGGLHIVNNYAKRQWQRKSYK